MRHSALAMLTVLLVCLFVAGCNRTPSNAAPPTANSTVSTGSVFTKNVTVSGQVFIVTKGGENFKLGLVKVSVADSKAVEDYKKSLAAEINKSLAGIKTSVNQALPDYLAALDKYNKMLPDYSAAQNALKSALSSNGVMYLDSLGQVDGVTADQAATIVKLDKERADIGEKIAPLHDDVVSKHKPITDLLGQQQADESTNLDTFIAEFPEQASTKTDADGKFSLSVPAGSTYVIVAKASRAVGEDTEYYKWIVPVDLTTASDGLTVMLSNDNLVDSVPDLPIDYSQVASDVPDVTEETIVTQPTSYTFKDASGNDVTPTAPTDSATANNDTTAATSVPAWTPPNPLPTKDNWTWTVGDKTYDNVVISGTDTTADTVSITYGEGVTHLPVATLPSDVQKLLNYQDPNAPAAPAVPFDTSITKTEPLEAYASDGSMTGVSQSVVGQNYKCLRIEDGKAVLQDAKGDIFKIQDDAINAAPNK